ncbi:MAG: hypothetical protein M1835_001901 [Candelina submexicana]|nr:MAG: hypothetical protein M1835_001901 [Candelina submexicana]
MPPQDEQTRKAFGFDKVLTLTEVKNLMGLYYGILFILKISTRKVHQWQVENQLAKHIKLEYEAKTPEEGKPEFFTWFLTNEGVVDQSLPASKVPGAWERAWQSIGSSAMKSGTEIKETIEAWPERKKESFLLYKLLLTGEHPQPVDPLWLCFGFCVCHEEQEEINLAKLYLSLIERCTFEEFWLSYNSAVLPGLFINKGLSPELEASGHLKVFLSLPPNRIHSVWLLKQLVYTEHKESTTAVSEDYGFANCSTAEDFVELKNVYRQVFELHMVDEMELDQACLAGSIYQYVSGMIEIDSKYARLMRNRYPSEEGQIRAQTVYS